MQRTKGTVCGESAAAAVASGSVAVGHAGAYAAQNKAEQLCHVGHDYCHVAATTAEAQLPSVLRTRRTVCGESAAAAAASSSAKVVTLGRTPRETSAAYTRSAWSSRPALPQALSAVLNVTAARGSRCSQQSCG